MEPRFSANELLLGARVLTTDPDGIYLDGVRIDGTSNKFSLGLDQVTNNAQVKRSEMGQPLGVATLDSSGKIPPGQLRVFGPSGPNHSIGLVPDPGAIAGITALLREDGNWVDLTGLDIPYTTLSNVSITNVQSALDILFYSPIAITTFSNNVGTVEVGSTVTSVILNWGLNKTPASLSLNNGIGSLSTSATQYIHSTSFITDRTYTLSADDGTINNGHSTNSSTLVHFSHKRYWGTSPNINLTSAQIISLNKEFAGNKVKSFVQDGNGEYIYYCYPASYGTATFTVNGLLNNAWTLTVQNFLNASGNTTSFNVYRTNTIQNGTGFQIGVS